MRSFLGYTVASWPEIHLINNLHYSLLKRFCLRFYLLYNFNIPLLFLSLSHSLCQWGWCDSGTQSVSVHQILNCRHRHIGDHLQGPLNMRSVLLSVSVMGIGTSCVYWQAGSVNHFGAGMSTVRQTNFYVPTRVTQKASHWFVKYQKKDQMYSCSKPPLVAHSRNLLSVLIMYSYLSAHTPLSFRHAIYATLNFCNVASALIFLLNGTWLYIFQRMYCMWFLCSTDYCGFI